MGPLASLALIQDAKNARIQAKLIALSALKAIFLMRVLHVKYVMLVVLPVHQQNVLSAKRIIPLDWFQTINALKNVNIHLFTMEQIACILVI